MKKVLMAMTVAACAFCASAFEKKDIPYYEDDALKTGNVEYLNERCKLDLRIPDGATNFATIVWFHGGGITAGSKHYPPHIAPNKFAIAAVDYRLSGARARCPDYLYDCAASVAWVFNHIEEFGGDPKKIYVSGMSAGGYLSAMMALAPKYLEKFGKKHTDLAGAFPISGQMTTHFRVLQERRENDPSTPDIFIDDLSPIGNARKGVCPIALFVGDTNYEWEARKEENFLLEARLRRNFGDKNVRVYSIDTCSHGTVMNPSLQIINNILLGRTRIW